MKNDLYHGIPSEKNQAKHLVGSEYCMESAIKFAYIFCFMQY